MDICDNGKETNKLRTKSSGHIITKEHEITLKQLVPYTLYNVQFSFVLNENYKNLTVNTLPTGTYILLTCLPISELSIFIL